MALRELLLPWDGQPRERASIDVTSEVALGLVAGFSTGTGRPIRHFEQGFATAAGATVASSSAGILLKLSGSSSGLQIPAVPIAGSTAVQVTSIVQITSQNAEMVFEQSATADSNAGFYLYGISASTLRLQVNNGTAFAVFPNSISYTFPATPVVVTVRVDISANPARGEFWADGVLVSAQTVALAAGTFLANTLNIGCRNGTTLSSDGAFGDTFVHSSWTQDSALAEWHRNLWAVYEPRRIWVPVSAGATTYTLSASTYVPGSITSTGLTARVTVTAA